MRILIFNWRDLDHPLAGGAEVYTDAVAREWVNMGHEVTLFCSYVDGRATSEVHSGGYTVFRRGSKHGVYREAKRFWLHEAEGQFDLVIDEVNTRPFHCPDFVTTVPVIALIHQVAREIWFHELPWVAGVVGRFLLEPLWLRPYRHVRTITVSESSRESLAGYGLRRLTVVPEGFDRSRLNASGCKEKRPTFIYVGRLSSNKRPDHVIEAFRVIRATLPEACLWIIGDGPLTGALQDDAPTGVKFFGRVSDAEKWSLLSRANVLLVTSVREGWGLVVTEAAAVGTIACGYDVPGLRDSLTASGGVICSESASELAKGAIMALQSTGEGTGSVVPGGVISWYEVAEKILSIAVQSEMSSVRMSRCFQNPESESSKDTVVPG